MININELIEKTIKELLQETKFINVINDGNFHFNNHKVIWDKIKNFEVSNKNFYEKLLKSIPIQSFTLKNYITMFDEKTKEYNFILLASIFVKMNDSRAPALINISTYDNVKNHIIASAGIYSMKKWLEDILKYKIASNSYINIQDKRFINLIQYLENPEENLTILLENDREKISQFALNKNYNSNTFTQNVFKYFDEYKINFQNKKNKGYFFTSVLYRIKDYWISILISAKERNLIQDLIKLVTANNIEIFYYKPDERGYKLWNECYVENTMLFGFDNIMTRIWNSNDYSYENIKKCVIKEEQKENIVTISIINRFINEVQKNDLIFAFEGNTKILGIGILRESKFYYNKNDKIFRSYKKVNWLLNLKKRELNVNILNLSTNIIGQTVVRYNIKDTLKILNYLINENNSININYNTEKDNEMAAENEIISSSGQGFLLDSKLRKEIEEYAMRKAKAYLLEKGFTEIKNVSANRPYDYVCYRMGKKFLVEVKGTQTLGKKIALTYNEVNIALNKDYNIILFIVHSISVIKREDKYYLSDGIEKVIKPFIIDEENLKPISYNYQI